jgi:hypothetical protein
MIESVRRCTGWAQMEDRNGVSLSAFQPFLGPLASFVSLARNPSSLLAAQNEVSRKDRKEHLTFLMSDLWLLTSDLAFQLGIRQLRAIRGQTSPRRQCRRSVLL